MARGNPKDSSRAASSGVLAAAALGGALAGSVQFAGVDQTVEDVPLLEALIVPVADEQPVSDGLGGMEPVVLEPETFDMAALTKAVAMAERQQRESSEAVGPREAGQPAGSTCARGDSGFGRVKNWVQDAGTELRCRFDVKTVHGMTGRAGTSDHPTGLALDLMVDRVQGDGLAAYAVQNMDRLGIRYVIYRQRINYGSGWQAMADRGSATANHMDHVHISFERLGILANRA